MINANDSQGAESRIELIDRKSLKLYGIEQMISFDDSTVVLSSHLGELEISGSELSIDALDPDKSFVAVSGEICGINYTDGMIRKKNRFRAGR